MFGGKIEETVSIPAPTPKYPGIFKRGFPEAAPNDRNVHLIKRSRNGLQYAYCLTGIYHIYGTEEQDKVTCPDCLEFLKGNDNSPK